MINATFSVAQHPVGDVGGEFRPMQHRQGDAAQHQSKPPHQPESRKNRAHQRQHQPEDAVGIEQGDAQRERVAEPLHQPSPIGLFRPLRHLFEIGRNLALEQIGGMQLGQQMDRLVLGWRIVLRLASRSFPDIAHRPPAVHQAQHKVGDRGQAVKTSGLMVLQNVPGLAAKHLSVNGGVRAQPRFEVGDAVPGITEERCVHRNSR